MSHQPDDLDTVRQWVSGSRISVGIPAYNEAEGVLPTLKSLWEAFGTLGLADVPFVLSDSYDQRSLSSVASVARWARDNGAVLEVNSLPRRRSLKEALNDIFERARSDVLILVNADV